MSPFITMKRLVNLSFSSRTGPAVSQRLVFLADGELYRVACAVTEKVRDVVRLVVGRQIISSNPLSRRRSI
jgi:hypothetical protein